MKNQTAVSWLLKELAKNNNFIPIMHWHSIGELIEEAKEMEKQQIMDAFFAGYNYDGGETEENAEQYYNQTYNL
jgi:hypothetical protein